MIVDGVIAAPRPPSIVGADPGFLETRLCA